MRNACLVDVPVGAHPDEDYIRLERENIVPCLLSRLFDAVLIVDRIIEKL